MSVGLVIHSGTRSESVIKILVIFVDFVHFEVVDRLLPSVGSKAGL